MSVEVEAKMKLEYPASLQNKLESLGATLERRLIETNTYFDSSDNQFKASDQGLRVRVEVDQDTSHTQTVLTHKGPRSHGKLKTRSETELIVEGPGQAAQMLSALGYEAVLMFEKYRCRYLLDSCRIEIDTLPYLGTYVEIEADHEDAVLAAQSRLGMADVPLIRASYIAMLMTYLREHQIDDKTIWLKDAGTSVGAP